MWRLLLSWIVPENHKGEVIWAAEANSCAVVIALVGFALLACWEFIELVSEAHRRITLPLAELAWHWFGEFSAVLFGLEQHAPSCGGVGLSFVAAAT